MKATLIVLLCVTLLAVANSHPLEEGVVRQRRATCDLLSGLGVADSACAARCILMGKRGGYCEKGTCHCRN
ncbi:sapecin-C [Anabrus simplex]|uniref:sapecin-C n=1 Tax=Anabrus simplex TaxID=316456 RepID=UPI0035A39B48